MVIMEEPDSMVEKKSKKTKLKRDKSPKVQEHKKKAKVDPVSPDSGEVPAPKPPKKKKKKKSTSAPDPDQDRANADVANVEEATTTAEPKPAPKTASKKGESLMKPKNPELERRTVFVGNIPLKVRRPALKKFFSRLAPVESVRLRSAPRLDARKPIRMSVITHRFSEERSSLNGYVRFTSEAGAEKAAAEANGALFMEHHLRVNRVTAEQRHEPRLAVFVGGLPLNVEDDQLWGRFAECGAIASVRVIRDARSSVGKGFGYVNFAEEAAAQRALKLNGAEIGGRTVRVQKCHATAHSKVDRVTGKKLRRERPAGEAGPRQQDKLAPVNKFSGDATAESKSALKKKKKKKERWDDAKRQKRNQAQSLSKTMAAAAPAPRAAAAPVTVGGVAPQNKKIKFEFDDDAPVVSARDEKAKLKEVRQKKEAKRKKKNRDSEAKKKRGIAEPLTNLLPS